MLLNQAHGSGRFRSSGLTTQSQLEGPRDALTNILLCVPLGVLLTLYISLYSLSEETGHIHRKAVVHHGQRLQGSCGRDAAGSCKCTVGSVELRHQIDLCGSRVLVIYRPPICLGSKAVERHVRCHVILHVVVESKTGPSRSQV